MISDSELMLTNLGATSTLKGWKHSPTTCQLLPKEFARGISFEAQVYFWILFLSSRPLFLASSSSSPKAFSLQFSPPSLLLFLFLERWYLRWRLTSRFITRIRIGYTFSCNILCTAAQFNRFWASPFIGRWLKSLVFFTNKDRTKSSHTVQSKLYGLLIY